MPVTFDQLYEREGQIMREAMIRRATPAFGAVYEGEMGALAAEWRQLHADEPGDPHSRACYVISAFLRCYPDLEHEGKVDALGGGECCSSLAGLLERFAAADA